MSQPCWPVAALNLATRSAGPRPRSFTLMPCARARARISVVFRPPAGPRRLPRAGLRALPPTRRAASTYRPAHRAIPGMPGVQFDLILGTVQSEADGTLGGAAVDVIDEAGSVSS